MSFHKPHFYFLLFFFFFSILSTLHRHHLLTLLPLLLSILLSTVAHQPLSLSLFFLPFFGLTLHASSFFFLPQSLTAFLILFPICCQLCSSLLPPPLTAFPLLLGVVWDSNLFFLLPPLQLLLSF